MSMARPAFRQMLSLLVGSSHRCARAEDPQARIVKAKNAILHAAYIQLFGEAIELFL
jgi:hypothetical protein